MAICFPTRLNINKQQTTVTSATTTKVGTGSKTQREKQRHGGKDTKEEQIHRGKDTNRETDTGAKTQTEKQTPGLRYRDTEKQGQRYTQRHRNIDIWAN